MLKNETIINLKAKLLQETVLSLDIEPGKVCQGICTESFFREIISDVKFPEKLVMDSLLQRVALQTDKYESVVSREEYEIIKQIDIIIEHIDCGNLDEAFDAIEKYHTMVEDRSDLYAQLEALLIGIARMESKTSKGNVMAYNAFMKAIRMTLHEYDGAASMVGGCISRMELILHVLMFKLECDKDILCVGPDRIAREVEVFDRQLGDPYSREIGRVLCFYAQYIGELALRYDMKKEAAYVSGAALKILKNICRTYNVINLLDIWSRAAEDGEDKNKAVWMRQQIMAFYKEFGVEKESFSWCVPYATNEVYPIDYVIRVRRSAMGMNQETLAAEICTGRTISNIEQGKYEPKPRSRTEILRRLGVNFCDYGVIESFDVEHHKMATEYARAVNGCDFEKSGELLKRLKEELPDTNVNRQFLRFKMETLEIVRSGKRIVCMLPGLISALERTCKVWNQNKEWHYSQMEVNLIHTIAELQFRKENSESARKLLESLMDFYENQEISLKHFEIGYSMVKSTLTCWLGDGIDGEGAVKIGKRNLKTELENGGSSVLVKHLYNMGWNIEKLEHDAGKDYKKGMKYMKYAYALGMLIDEKILRYIERNVEQKYGINTFL